MTGRPLSFPERAIWLAQQRVPRASAYNTVVATEIAGPLDVKALRDALRDVVQRHEPLRTAIRTVDGEPVAVPCADPEVEVAVRQIPAGDDWRIAAREHVRRPFDLAAGILVRAVVLRSAPERSALVLVVHHIAVDGWSWGILRTELSEAYAARVERTLWRPPPLPTTYGSHVTEVLSEADTGPAYEHWLGKLADAPETSTIPPDRPRPAVPDLRAGLVEWEGTPRLAADLDALRTALRTSLFSVVVAAWSVTLSRYLHQDDLVFGVPVVGRPSSLSEPLVGLFSHPVPVRVRPRTDAAFADLVTAVRRDLFEAVEFGEVSLDAVLGGLRIERSTATSPLFQVVLNSGDVQDEPLRLAGASCRPVGGFERTILTDVELRTGLRGAGGPAFTLAYREDLYERSTIQTVLEHFGAVLTEAVRSPGTPIGRLRMSPEHVMPRTDRPLAGAGADSDLDDLVLVPELIARAGTGPSDIAIIEGSHPVDRAALARRTDRLAALLAAAGVRRGVLVGILLPRGAEYVAAVLAVWRLGGCFLPLDPRVPSERSLRIIRAARPVCLLVERSGLPWLRDVGVPILVGPSDGAAADAGAPPSAPAGTRGSPEDVAYVIYTSGSTGDPKGVEVSHRALAHLVRSMARRPGLDRDDVVLALTSPSFDISLAELLLPLAVGARVVVAPPEAGRDPAACTALIRRHGVTVVQATPTGWRHLLAADWSGVRLRRAWCGGEALDAALAERLVAGADEAWNLYGPTETTVWSLAARLRSGMRTVPLGEPIGRTEVRIVDSGGGPAGADVVGELWLGGPGVALGYRGDPVLTASRFVAAGALDGVGGAGAAGADRVYRTGDLVRRRADGAIEFLGRADRQLKIRGHRVEPGEIEAVLRRHEEVRDAVVVPRRAPDGEWILAAYVVRRKGTDGEP